MSFTMQIKLPLALFTSDSLDVCLHTYHSSQGEGSVS